MLSPSSRAWYRNIDWWIIAAWVGLFTIGIVAIYSTTQGRSTEFLFEQVQESVDRQLMWFGAAAFAMAVVLLTPAAYIDKLAFVAYGFTIALLVIQSAMVVAGIAVEVNGGYRWLVLGPVRIQVGEVAKVGALLAAAKVLSLPKARAGDWRYIIGAMLTLVLPAILIVHQNDTGTALVYLVLIPVLLFWSGTVPLWLIGLMLAPALAGYFAIVNMTWALIFGLIVVVAMMVFTRSWWRTALAAGATFGVSLMMSFFVSSVLLPHQRGRIVAFLEPEAYASTLGYHVLQVRAAIGSGGLFGQGFMQGTQTQLAFIPEQSTDFIFSVIGEEWGFLGGALVFALFGLLLIRLARLSAASNYALPKLFCAGAAGLYMFHFIINIGMNVGLVPVIGLPLPFLSYGGSALLAHSVLLGIALNLYARRGELGIYSS
ncbi:rod shape-determining protein RodA [soil metagenome]